MKNVTPNIQDVLTAKFISQLARLRKFKRYWGTTVVNGHEVFTGEKYFYPEMDESTTKLTRFLRIYKELTGQLEGVRSAWLFLNPEKANDSTITWQTDGLVRNFNRSFNKDLKGSIVIGPRAVKALRDQNTSWTTVSPPISSPETNQEALINEIRANYTSYWQSDFSIFSSEADSYQAILLMYLLRTTDIPYTIDSVQKIVANAFVPTSLNTPDSISAIRGTAWRVNFTVPQYEFSNSSSIISALVNDLSNTSYTATQQVRNLITVGGVPTTGNDGSDEGIADTEYEQVATDPSNFWVKVPIGAVLIRTVNVGTEADPIYQGIYETIYKCYLKTSIIETTSLSKEDRIKYIFGCIDTGYRKKKRKWYQVLLAMVIIVVSFYLAGPAGSAAAAAVGGGAWGAVVMVSVYITMATMYVSIATYAAHLLNLSGVTASLGQFLKAINPIAKVASVVAFVAVLQNVVREGVRRATEQAVAQSARASIMDITIEVVKVGIEQVAGVTNFRNMSLEHITKMTKFTFNIYQDWQTRDLQRELENYRKELAQLEQVKEQNNTTDIVKELMLSYPNVLTQDNSIYAERYDLPYEWWSTPFHTGCSQANSVNALWLNRD